jgi:copper(I)-binding protein
VRPAGPSLLAYVAYVAYVACAAALLAGCGRPNPRIPEPWNVAVNTGSNVQVAGLAVQNVTIPYRGPITGNAVYRPGGAAEVDATIVNTTGSPDRLLSIGSPVATGGQVSGPALLPAGHTLAASSGPPGPPLPNTSPIELKLTGLTSPIRAGHSYPVVFTFARAGQVRLQVSVENPNIPLPECPLPSDGRPHELYTAPIGAPPPPTGTPPDCSTLIYNKPGRG